MSPEEQITKSQKYLARSYSIVPIRENCWGVSDGFMSRDFIGIFDTAGLLALFSDSFNNEWRLEEARKKELAAAKIATPDLDDLLKDLEL